MVFWQGNNQIYGHIQCLYTILANSIYNSQASGINGSMLQFAVGFVIYTKAWREIKNQKWAAGPHKSKTMQRSKCQVHKSDTSELRWEHPQDKAQAERGGGGREKQPEQNQGIKRMPKTRVHSTLCKVLARSQPTLTTQELQFYS